MSIDTSDPALAKAYEEVQDHSSPLDWLTVKYTPNTAVALAASGSNGLAELKVALAKNLDEAQFALLNLESRSLLISLLPETIGGVKRARALVHARAIGALFPAHSATLTVGSVDELSTSAVRNKLRLDGSSIPSSPNPQRGSESPLPPHETDVRNSPTFSQSSGDGIAKSPRKFSLGSLRLKRDSGENKRLSSAHKSEDSRELSPAALHFLTAQADAPRDAESGEAERSDPLKRSSLPATANSPAEPQDASREEERPLPRRPSPPPKHLPLPPPTAGDLTASFNRQTDMPSPIPLPVNNSTNAQSPPIVDYLASRPTLPHTASARAVKNVPVGTPPADPSEQSGSREPATSQAEDIKEAYRQGVMRDALEEGWSSAPIPMPNGILSRDDPIKNAAQETPPDPDDEHRVQSQLAEQRARAKWEAESAERARLDQLERQRLESEERERREAADRLRQEEEYRAAQAAAEEKRRFEEQEKTAAEARRKAAQERAQEEARLAEIERQRKIEEEERVAAEAKEQARAQILAQFSQKKSEGKTMLAGTVSVQGGGGSMIWRRRWFELHPQSLLLYKSQSDVGKPITTIPLDSRPHISDGFEETQIAHSFKLSQNGQDDPYLFYCDEEADKDLILSAMSIATQ